jgi:hypothetical protein
MEELTRHGPRLFPGSEPVALSKAADGISVAFKDGSRQGPFDQVSSFDCGNFMSESLTGVTLRFYGLLVDRPPPAS